MTDAKLRKVECDDSEYVVVQKNYDYEHFTDRRAKFVVFDQPMELGFQRGMPPQAEATDALFTGMDAAKTSHRMRYCNFYLTHAIENQFRPLSTARGPSRFVLLIKKPKAWRLWFQSQVAADATGPNRTFEGTARQGSAFADAMLEPRGRIHVILESQPSSGFGCAFAERITEKTFNAIAYAHPFFVIGTNHVLDLVRAHGFETFFSCFNESYAKIANPKARMQAAIYEINRLNNLSEAEFQETFQCAEKIAKKNREILLSEIKRKQAQQRLYAWGMSEIPGYDFSEFHRIIDKDFNLTACRK